MKHLPVLLEDVVGAFEGKKLGVFFDGTVGAGGHAKHILEAHPEIEIYLAIDQDETAIEIAKKTLQKWEEKVRFVHSSFSQIQDVVRRAKVPSLDGFLLDVGVSSMQLDRKERGFSFSQDAPLDMRMNQKGDVTARDLVNSSSEKELARIFYEYGEERRSYAIAKAIVERRKKKKLETTQELAELVKKIVRGSKKHPATKVFQALRIAVNDELGELERGLKNGSSLLKEGARLAVISFHSLEDRIVKWTLRNDPSLEVITKKPIAPTREEIRQNPRARSAKLRIAEKKENVPC